MPSFLEQMENHNGEEISTRFTSTSENVALNDDLTVPFASRSYHQYANIYFLRLDSLKPRVNIVADNAWKDIEFDGISVKHFSRVLEVRQGILSWVTGTVYKEMKFKPNILKEVSEYRYGAPPVNIEKYTGDSDEILLEDESGRMKLTGDVIKSLPLVTGCVIAVLGTELASGDFDVIDVKTAGFAPQKPLAISQNQCKVALVSGLSIGSGDNDYRLDLLQEYLTGELSPNASSISRLIIAGNSILEGSMEIDQTGKPTKYGHDSTVYNATSLHTLDQLISNTAVSIPVSIMPGATDLANIALPQQSLHRGLFPLSRAFLPLNSLETVTNPHWWELDGVRMLGTSGQTIDDIYKYLDEGNRLEIMEQTLRWQHIAPTAPDTLFCYPYYNIDPFVLEETPHVYFVGNQDKFATRLVSGSDTKGNDVEVRIISLPKFSENGEFVLLNLQTLEVELVRLSQSKSRTTS